MKRILITQQVVNIAEKYASSLFSKRAANFQRPLFLLNELEQSLRQKQHIPYANYVLSIYNNYNKILILKPSEFDAFNQNLPQVQLNQKGLIKSNSPEFYKLVVKAMRYDDIRQDYLSYIRKLGIKTCVYCNAQYAITVRGKELFATYQFDHFYPKSEYPFLCTSFFNLQPSCSACNQRKTTKKAEFNLYTENKDELFPFYFTLNKSKIIKYLLNKDTSSIELKLGVYSKIPNGQNLLQNHLDIFHIDELYAEHKDVVEEIVWKSKIYNPSYINQLLSSFKKLQPNDLRNDFYRFMLNIPYDRSKIHDRPLTLLIQDIAKQLGIR